MIYTSNQKGLPKRILALVLTACMVFTMSPPITAAQASEKDNNEPVMLSGFVDLPQNIREQNVPIGTSSVGLTLPETLEATVHSAPEDTKPVPPTEPAAPSQPQDSGTPPESEKPEAVPPAEDTAPPESVPPAEESAPPESVPAAEESAPPESVPAAEESAPPESVPPTEESAPPAKEPIAPPESTPPAEQSTPPVTEQQPAADTPNEDAAQDEQPDVTPPAQSDEPASKAEIIEENIVPLAASPSDAEKNKPESTQPEPTRPSEDVTAPAVVTVSGVTWESDPLYDSETEGTYLFTAVLPSGYTVEDGVAMPEITVVVGQAEQSAADKVIAMIDALPSYAELTADPPAEETPEYAAWLAKTKKTLDEILAAKAAYDAISAEEKAQIDETRTAKLLELVELAEQMVLMMPMAADIASGTNGSCNWVIDADGLMTISPKNGTSGVIYGSDSYAYIPWADNVRDVKKVLINSGVSTGNSAARLFYGFVNCTEIDLTNLSTAGTTDMTNLFCSCKALTTLIFGSNFDTSSVTNMGGMFTECTSLEKLDISQFDTQKVENAGSMFNSMTSLTELTLGNSFSSGALKFIGSMFSCCEKLEALDVSKFDTSNVEVVNAMFNKCAALTSLDLSNFTISNPTNLRGMFRDCAKLETITFGAGFDTKFAKDMSHMFADCSALKSLDVSSFTTDKVAYMEYMFAGCSTLTTLDLSGFVTSNVNDMSNMFNGCTSLSALDLGGFTTDKLQYKSNMFVNCTLGLDISFFEQSMHGYYTKIYLFNKRSKDELPGTDLRDKEDYVVYKPYAITKSAANGSFTTSSRFNATDYGNYFTKTAPLYPTVETPPSYDSTKDYAQLREKVTINLTPASGYLLDTVTVTKAGGGEVTLSGTGNTRTFTMPADDVTVTAKFKAPNFTVAVKEIADTAVTITLTPDEGGKVYWLVDPTGVPSADEIKTGGNSQAVTGGREKELVITGLAPGKKHTIYMVIADAAGNLSEVKEVDFVTKQTAPTVSLGDLGVDYEKETITPPAGTEVYTDPDDPEGSKLTPDGGKVTVNPSDTVYIRYPEKDVGGGETIPASP